jgi:hypothetical protein
MISSQSQFSLTQRTGLALTAALRQERARDVPAADGRIRGIGDLLIAGIRSEQLPDSIHRTRLRSPDSAAALAVNSFLPWRGAIGALPLAGWVGFDAVQFDVRCPTGLRGTPPHLDLLALRVEVAVAVTVRCTEYLSRRKTGIAPSYDRLVAATPGLDQWRQQLDRLRAEPRRYRHVDLGALIKFAVALGRTFPERLTALLYLFWEPLDADRFEEFGRHREELAELQEAVKDGRVTFTAISFDAMWRDWAERDTPVWVAAHVDRLRARYCVSIAGEAR